jgi:MoaD family protein
MKQIYNKPHLSNHLKTHLVPTVKIKIEYLGHVRNLLNTKRQEEIEINEDSTMQDLLNTLAKKHGELFKKAIYEPGSPDLKANFIATVNGHLLNQLQGISTKLKNNDKVTIMPIVSGG